MAEEQDTEMVQGRERADEGDELRTIGFRLREIQRLLAVRVEQENRRLESDGIEPIEEPRFRDPE
jgi:hypothetical protein